MDIAFGRILARKMWITFAARLALVPVFLAVATASPTLLLLGSGPALAQTYSFSNVAIEGNERVDAATILSFAGIGRGQRVSGGELNDAYQRIVDSGLFETVEMVPQGNRLLIRVREYPTINVINFEGNRRLKDENLQALIRSQSRRVYSPAQAEADATTITEAYENAGRVAATVDPRIIRRSGNRVDLVFEIREGRVSEIERIGFVGNRNISDRRLRQVLATKQAGLFRQIISRDTFVADRLEFDKQLLRDFYASRGYVDFEVLDASAEITRERDAFFVTFTIREGQSFRVGSVSVVSEIDEADAEEFRSVMRLRSGVTYTPTVLETNITRMENLALRKGLNFVRVEPRITRNDRDLTLDVEFAITRGPRIFVERIDIEGNTTTLDQVIRRQFRTVEGDPFNPREIRQAAERIRALGFFSNANVEAEQGSGSDQVIVNVDVEEQPTGSLGLGASYGVDSGIGFNISFSENNFLGRGQSLSLGVTTASESKSATLSFGEPAFLGRDLRFGLDLYYTENDSEDSLYNTRNVGLRPSLGFPVGENSRFDLRYRISQDRITGVPDGSSAIIQKEATLGALVTSSLGYSYTYDSRRTGLNPSGGVLLRFGQDFAGLGGDTKFVQTSVTALGERRILNDEVTLRAVFEGGAINMIDGESRVTERFFGIGKIRGFERFGLGPRDLESPNQDALGGNFFFVARFEAEFPLGLPEEYGIKGGLFFDVGSVWGLNNRIGTNGIEVDDSLHLRSSIGVSLFWDTPVGPLRFNLSRALEKQPYDKEQTFDLTISTQF
ncbi:MAG: outer membrane protein assembly factor BamA [Paracoccaceae bacterium]|nr:MAG: outer membrane protein assembly factor BamA [Paracoccaceae bacterium]